MATITTAAVTPANITKGGGQATVTAQINNPDATGNVLLQLDGKTYAVGLTLHEPVTWSVNPADLGKPGVLVVTLDSVLGPLCGLALGADGQSAVVTAL